MLIRSTQPRSLTCAVHSRFLWESNAATDLTGGGAQAVTQLMGSGCKYRWSFIRSPSAYLLLCGLVPNRPRTSTRLWPWGLGTPVLWWVTVKASPLSRDQIKHHQWWDKWKPGTTWKDGWKVNTAHFYDIPAKDAWFQSHHKETSNKPRLRDPLKNKPACNLQKCQVIKSRKDWGTALDWRGLKRHDN